MENTKREKKGGGSAHGTKAAREGKDLGGWSGNVRKPIPQLASPLNGCAILDKSFT